MGNWMAQSSKRSILAIDPYRNPMDKSPKKNNQLASQRQKRDGR
jgi:hypothetical protein